MYERILEIPKDNPKLKFTIREITFITGLSPNNISRLMVDVKSPYKLEDLSLHLNNGMQSNVGLFSRILGQVNMRLWSLMKDLPVSRVRNEDETFEYTYVHTGASSLIRKYSTQEQKQLFFDIMSRTKFDTMWRNEEKVQWDKEMNKSIGLCKK